MLHAKGHGTSTCKYLPTASCLQQTNHAGRSTLGLATQHPSDKEHTLFDNVSYPAGTARRGMHTLAQILIAQDSRNRLRLHHRAEDGFGNLFRCKSADGAMVGGNRTVS